MSPHLYIIPIHCIRTLSLGASTLSYHSHHTFLVRLLTWGHRYFVSICIIYLCYTHCKTLSKWKTGTLSHHSHYIFHVRPLAHRNKYSVSLFSLYSFSGTPHACHRGTSTLSLHVYHIISFKYTYCQALATLELLPILIMLILYQANFTARMCHPTSLWHLGVGTLSLLVQLILTLP